MGYTDHLVPIRQSPNYSKGILYTKPEENLAHYIDVLRNQEQCIYVIIVGHLGLSQQIHLSNLEACKGADYIFGGDTHESCLLYTSLGYIPSTNVYDGPLQTVKMIGFDDFKSAANNGDTQIIDLRGDAEYKAGHIKGAKHVFVGTILENTDKINKNKDVVIHCQGGDRASIAYSLLAKAGFTNITNYSPGMNEWVAKGCLLYTSRGVG